MLIKAWDETFSQTVQQRYSYRYHDIVWGGKFEPAFEVDQNGSLEVFTTRIHDLRRQHQRKPSLMERFDAAGLA